MRRLVRNYAAASTRVSGLLWVVERGACSRLTILCYHRILPTELRAEYPLPDLVVTPESFRHQCMTLKRHYEVLPLHEAVEGFRTRRGSDRPVATITFDDGYQDNFIYAQPILASLKLRATFFVIAGLVGNDEVPWYDKLARAARVLQQQNLEQIAREVAGSTVNNGWESLNHDQSSPWKVLMELAKAMPPDERGRFVSRLSSSMPGEIRVTSTDCIMDWRHLAALIDAGHEIGSHGLTHELLPLLDDHALEVEVVESRRLLEERLSHPIRSFCYPNGDLDGRVARVVASAGYQNAVTTEPGLNELKTDRLRLRRWFIHEERLSGFGHRPSATLLRMELCGLASRLFRRQGPVPRQS